MAPRTTMRLLLVAALALVAATLAAAGRSADYADATAGPGQASSERASERRLARAAAKGAGQRRAGRAPTSFYGGPPPAGLGPRLEAAQLVPRQGLP